MSFLWKYLRCLGTTTTLPQNDEDLKNARKDYQLEQKDFGFSIEAGEIDLVKIPPMLKNVPCGEKYPMYKIRFGITFAKFQIYEWIYGRGEWTLDDMISHLRSSWILTEPKGLKVWREEGVNTESQTQKQMAQADYWFAWQRMNGVTRNLIRLTQNIPHQFQNFENEVGTTHPYLGGKTLDDLLKENMLYVVDLTDVALDQPDVYSPVALFTIYNNKLMPIAINADFEEDREIFAPPPFNAAHASHRQWLKAKMWFNMLDAQYHESITHLGFTHILMDGVSVCLHRNVWQRHPIYKLMVPHFRHMHAINNEALTTLLAKNGFIDKDMWYRREHVLKLIGRHNEKWHLNKQGDLEWDIENRGVKVTSQLILTSRQDLLFVNKNLPGYYFRDDALKIHGAIRDYVTDYLKLYYLNDKAVRDDTEIQSFREQLIRPRVLKGEGGCGMQGVPAFDSIDNLAATLTNFIFICSVEHSATNFPQYEQYGFSPCYPAKLCGNPKTHHGAIELDAALPSKKDFFSTIKIMQVLTTVLTNKLGHHEKEYMRAFDNEGRQSVLKFQEALNKISEDIKIRNELVRQENAEGESQVQDYIYTWLDPDRVLNSISI